MMRKSILILFFSISIIGFGQSKAEVTEAMNSNDTKLIASFIKKYPKHPKVASLRQRILQIIINKTEKSDTISGKVENKVPIKTEKLENDKTADILNYLLNDNSKSEQAYVLIKNLSKCDISVLFEGKKTHTLNISSNSLNRILLDKGNYKISSKVCNANYREGKEITKDIEIVLNISTKVK